VDGQVIGPVSLNSVAEMIRSGQLKANTPVSPDGSEFRPMKAFPELALLLSVDVELPDSGEGDDLIETPATYSGVIEEVSLPKLMFHFSAAKATGRLVLQDERFKKQIFLQNGKPVAALSSNPEEQLGRFLVQFGGLDPFVIEGMLAEVGGQEDRLGDILIHRGLLEPHKLFEILRELLLHKVFETFSWRQGSYGFYDGQVHKGSLLPLNLNPWELVAEGVRQGYSQDELRELLLPLRNHLLVARENEHVHLNQLVLSPRELKVFNLLAGGGRTLAGVLEKLASDEDSERTVLTMVYLGIEMELVGVGESVLTDAVSAEDSAAWDSMLGETASTPKPLEPPPRPGPPPTRPAPPAGPIRATPPLSPEEKKLLDVFNAMKTKNYFERLELEPGIGASAANKAFVRHARAYHPDQIPADAGEGTRKLCSDIFALLNEAHQVLSDDKRRKEYEEALATGLANADGAVDVSKIMDAELMFQRAETMVANRRHGEALKLLDQAIELNPDEGEFLIYRGYAAFAARPSPDSLFRDKCIKEIEKGLKMRENNVPIGFVFLGRIHQAAGELDKAMTAFRKALSLERNHVEAARELRLLESRQKDKKSLFGRRK
jgi:curved DNA-binding protein CbpA